jgi:hypothetical protein
MSCDKDIQLNKDTVYKIYKSENNEYKNFWMNYLRGGNSKYEITFKSDSYNRNIYTSQFKSNNYSITLSSNISSVNINQHTIFQGKENNYSPFIDNTFENDFIAEFWNSNIAISNLNIQSNTRIAESNTCYIPKEIYFTNPINNNIGTTPPIHKRQLKINWNKDEDNKNGIAVVLFWEGSYASKPYQFTTKASNFYNIYLLDDDGEAILQPDIFTNYPDSAYINISLFRGNISTIENQLTIKSESRAGGYFNLFND